MWSLLARGGALPAAMQARRRAGALHERETVAGEEPRRNARHRCALWRPEPSGDLLFCGRFAKIELDMLPEPAQPSVKRGLGYVAALADALDRRAV
jgi:hypothetical protein